MKHEVQSSRSINDSVSSDQGVPFCNVTFNVLRRMEFTSSRKRMSILIKDPLDGNKYKLLTKGADSIIKARLRISHNDQGTLTDTDRFLESCSK